MDSLSLDQIRGNRKSLLIFLDSIIGQEQAHTIESFLAWNGKFDKPIDKDYKISLCTVSRNRCECIKRTLRQNIEDNEDYSNVEFVLLDYNSDDGLEGWVKSEMMEFIENGTLVYFRTEEPKYHSLPHSLNVAFKAASGDIVNAVDADNFTSKGFANHINKLANQRAERATFAKGMTTIRGRIGFYKNEFIDILGGYNENVVGYGPCDRDLLSRSRYLGFRLMWFGGGYCLRLVDDENHHHPDKLINYSPGFTGGSPRGWMKLNNIHLSASILAGFLKANQGREWGTARLVKNFREEVIIC